MVRNCYNSAVFFVVVLASFFKINDICSWFLNFGVFIFFRQVISHSSFHFDCQFQMMNCLFTIYILFPFLPFLILLLFACLASNKSICSGTDWDKINTYLFLCSLNFLMILHVPMNSYSNNFYAFNHAVVGRLCYLLNFCSKRKCHFFAVVFFCDDMPIAEVYSL